MSNKKKPAPKRTSKPLPSRLYAKLVEVDALMTRQKWVQARAELQALNGQFGRRPEILEMLAEACGHLQDSAGYEQAAIQLIALVPEEPELSYNLGIAYYQNVRPGMAIRQLRQFIEKWPEHELAAEARTMVEALEPAARKSWEGMGFPEDTAEELAIIHEQINSLMEGRHYQEARNLAKDLTQKAPYFPSGWNNLSLLQWITGQHDAAIETSQRALEIAPHNIHALSNLVRLLLLRGKSEEAQKMAVALREAPAHAMELFMKKAEAFSYLGDDKAVLEVYSEAERAKQLPKQGFDPLIYHLAAVAYARQGNENKAHRCWQLALDIHPGYSFASANLEDFKQKSGQRNAPWAFPFQNWVDKTVMDSLRTLLKSHERSSPETVERLVRKWLLSHPNIEQLVPHLLDRGDHSAREFAMMLVEKAPTPFLLEAARDFGLGQRGTDSMRHRAAQLAYEARIIDNPVRLWIGEEWREIHLYSFDVHDQGTPQPNRKIQQLIAKGRETMKIGYAVDAEKLYREALDIEPGIPEVMNNLAAALFEQNREAEALAILHEILAAHPEYLFARVSLARVALRDRKPEEARELLEPLLERRRFHTSEFRAFAIAQIDLCLYQKQIEAAKLWLQLWENAMPEDEMLPAYQQKVNKGR